MISRPLLRFVRFSMAMFCLCFATLLNAQTFQHSVEQEPLPWTHENFDADPQKFTFAIHSI